MAIAPGCNDGPNELLFKILVGVNEISEGSGGGGGGDAIATGGYTPGKLVSAAGTNATVIKAAPGTLGLLTASNVNAAPRYVKVYNSAAPVVGVTIPVFTFLIPGNANGTGTNIPIATAKGVNFDAGISFALTTGVADADTGAVAAGEIAVNYAYA